VELLTVVVGGVVTVSDVGEFTVITAGMTMLAVAPTATKFTVGPLTNPVPFTVKVVPPVTGPCAGEIDVTVGMLPPPPLELLMVIPAPSCGPLDE
jgi:hypothetical protein